jgi:hypothetical protein
MADRARDKTRIRISDSDYEYICRVARALATGGKDPNCTDALRRIIHEHRSYSVGAKLATSHSDNVHQDA